MAGNRRSGDRAAEQVMQWGKAYCDWVETCFDRADKLKPCPTGARGACCKHCHMGPCRFIQSSEERVEKGVCGATIATVAARNLLRMAAAGAAAGAEQARELGRALLRIADGEIQDLQATGIERLNALAETLGITHKGRTPSSVCRDVASRLMIDLSRQEEMPGHAERAPAGLRRKWEEAGVLPRGVDREVVEALFRTGVGVDHDPESLLRTALRVCISDGWGASLMAADISSILCGPARPFKSEAGLGSFREETVNILLVGEDPVFLRALGEAAEGPDIQGQAASHGAKGITFGGTFAPMPGVSAVGGLTNQEASIMTGVVEAAVIAAPCVMPGLLEAARSFHTKVFAISQKVTVPGAEALKYDTGHAGEIARDILLAAIENYPNRSGTGERVTETFPVTAGFSPAYLMAEPGSGNGSIINRLAGAVCEGRIRGMAGLFGNDNPRVQATGIYQYLAREFIASDILVLAVESGASSCAVSGLLDPEAALREAGPELRKACMEAGVPPVLSIGTPAGVSHMLEILTALGSAVVSQTKKGMPAVALAPEWLSEREIAEGFAFAGSGIPVIFGGTSPVEASDEVAEILSKTWPGRIGGSIQFEPDIERMLDLAIAAIDETRGAPCLEDPVSGGGA